MAKLSLDAYAELFFTTGPRELFGAQNFGLTFSVPGIVTIGPNLKVIGVSFPPYIILDPVIDLCLGTVWYCCIASVSSLHPRK